MTRSPIPQPVLAVVADVLSGYYTHGKLNLLFAECGAPGDAPDGNKQDKCFVWLKRLNATSTHDPLSVLGKLLENFMEVDLAAPNYGNAPQSKGRERITAMLAKHGLRYQQGGRILGAGAATPTRSLEAVLRAKDLGAVQTEFERALAMVEQDPPAAVTAASAVLEAFCKIYCEDEGLELPKEQSAKPLWKTVQAHIGLDPAKMEDDDLKRILSGLSSIVDGIASFRTHAGSAHGRGRKAYQVAPRHARLVLHAAHSLVGFALETWDARRTKAG